MKSIKFETLSRYDEENVPVVAFLPFRENELHEEELSAYRIIDARYDYPFQHKVTARYHNGSVRFLIMRFLASFEANKNKEFFFARENEANGRTVKEVSSLTVEKSAESVNIRNGKLNLLLGAPGDTLIRNFSLEGASDGAETEGPFISDGEKEYKALTGEDGWKVDESGPLFVSLHTTGRHTDGSSSWFDYNFSISVWTGIPYAEIDYQITNREKARTESSITLTIDNQQAGLKYDDEYPREILHSLRFRIKPVWTEETVKAFYTSTFNAHAELAKADETISHVIDADCIMNTATEMFPEVMFSTFGCTWKNRDSVVGCEVFQAYQNFPKSVHMNRNDIELGLYAEEAEPIEFPQGVQKTTKFFLFAEKPDMTERETVNLLLRLEMPPQNYVDVSDYTDAGIFGNEVSPLYESTTERFIYRFADARAKGLGFLNFGDCPEWEYSKQGRSKGRDIWINNEYDLVHNFVIMFARSGDRRYFDYAKAAMRHWLDVDFCHFSEKPYHEGLLYTHSVNHVSGQMVPSHQWVQGFIDYYHLTGDDEAYSAAFTIGNRLEELVNLPIYNIPGMVEPREIGWALRNFIDLYNESGDRRWLDDCTPIVDTYIRWADLMGTWTSPYPDNYMDRVPFMMQVGIGGVYEYYKIAGGEKIRKTLLTVIDDIVSNCYVPRLDMFLCKMHPSIRFQNLNGMVLETLETGYRLTGDVEYLKKGMGMFDWITKENYPPIYDFSKLKRDEHTIIYNCPVGPKRFSQTIIPLLKFYTAAMENGLIRHADTE